MAGDGGAPAGGTVAAEGAQAAAISRMHPSVRKFICGKIAFAGWIAKLAARTSLRECNSIVTYS